MNDIDRNHLDRASHPPAPEDFDGEYAIHGAVSVTEGDVVLIDGEPLAKRISREVLKLRESFYGVIDIEIVER